MLTPRRSAVLALACVGTFLASCGGGAESTAPVMSGSATSGADATGRLTVFAASSLSSAFEDLVAEFEAAHPDADVVLNLGGSSSLARQIAEGAPADVFATADGATMTRLADDLGEELDAQVFTTNRAQIVVAAGNPMGIDDVADLADPVVVVVSCAPEVPCGSYAEEVFARAGLEVTPRSLEENVKAVVSKVALGEADAGIVYVTDVIAAGDSVAGVALPDALNVVADYPIATVPGAPNAEAARAFVDFVLSPAGQRILTTHGFVTP